MTRPRIGVSVSRRTGWIVFPLMALNVFLGGGRAIRWQSLDDVDLSAVDGVLIGGGDDISPTLYDGDLTLSARLDPDRDHLEKTILTEAFDQGLPILGICRGSQMLNVVLGGSLHQDAFPFYGSDYYRTVLPRRCVEVEEDSRLAQITGGNTMNVNALHRQAVDRLGDGLRVAARDSRGMVQAIERVADPFAVGVQWHPEHLFYAKPHRALFAALVTAARAYRRDAPQLRRLDKKLSMGGKILGTSR
ncbi:MAG: gamma-glutamyl-gamma-aminobutyrate hydrolase family protein [Pseudomonadota bacterium]